MADVDLDNWDPTHVYLAFWLQDRIRRRGLDGIGYAAMAERWAVKNAGDETADEISKELRKL